MSLEEGLFRFSSQNFGSCDEAASDANAVNGRNEQLLLPGQPALLGDHDGNGQEFGQPVRVSPVLCGDANEEGIAITRESGRSQGEGKTQVREGSRGRDFWQT